MKKRKVQGYKIRVFDTRFPLNMPTSELHRLIREERDFDNRLEAFIQESKSLARRIAEENRPRKYYGLSLKLHEFLKTEGIDLLAETLPDQPKYKQKSALLQRLAKEVLHLEETEQLTNVRALFLFPVLEPDPAQIDWGITWHRRFELLRLHGPTLNPEDPIFSRERKRLEKLVSSGEIATREELRQIVTERATQLRSRHASGSLDGQAEDSGQI